jgi:flagellar hook-basal body complex protein FliE
VSIDPIALGALPFAPVTPAAGLAPSESAALRPTDAGDTFAAKLAGGVEQLQAVQGRADTLAVQAATGELRDAHDFMIASTEAALATDLTVAVRNKAVEAFNEILRMQV